MTEMKTADPAAYDTTSFFIGLSLAVCSSLFIGTSFVVKKIGLRRLASRGFLRAGAGGFRYLREWIWWLGLLTMGVGEALNFIAYAFAPASLVTPLGALSVLVSAIAASRFLGEKMNLLGKLGCALCAVGSTVIVIHSPKREEIETLEELRAKLQEPLFLTYLMFVVFVFFAVAFHLGPKYGDRNIVVHLLLCSAVGSLTVVFCKGIGVSLRETISGRADDLDLWLPWFLIAAVVVCITLQMNYLNKSLDVFDTSVVTPVYYVMFTTLVVLASAILFKEWRHMGAEDVLGNACGFFNVVVGILLLNTFREVDVNAKDSTFNFRNRRDAPKPVDSLTGTDAGNREEIGYGSYGSRVT